MVSFCSLSVAAQDYDLDYFGAPVKHSIRLSGSFAELRTNHFHMGIDIKSSNGRSGDPILAAAEGYVSRINVDPSGYGNAIYIDHPNGYTSVYAHLSSFSDTISDYVNRMQYETSSFQQRLYPDSIFYVKKGDMIGKMGNSGRSFGPHLHFEIRETQSEIPVNPFLFGIKPTDNRPPVFKAIKFYKVDSAGVHAQILELPVVNKGNGNFELKDQNIALPARRVSFAVETYDQMDGAYNKNGVYLMKVTVDNKVMHGYRMDKVSYDESHFINAFIDYAEKQKSKRQFANCFKHPADSLSVYRHKDDRNGIIKLGDKTAKNVRIELHDFEENISVLSFQLRAGITEQTEESKPYNYQIKNELKNIIRLAKADLVFEAGSFVSDRNIHISETLEINDGLQLPSYSIGSHTIPMFQEFTLRLKNLEIPDSLRAHFCVYQCEDQQKTAHQGKWQDNDYYINLDQLGNYTSGFDREAPKITPVNLKDDMTGQNSIRLRIEDDFKPASRSEWLQFHGSIDGNWVLFQYDLKKDMIYYNFDEKCPPGKHLLKVTVRDSRGNERHLNHHFTRF